jgi:lipopolysaccharide biosynthesis regulator YciM
MRILLLLALVIVGGGGYLAYLNPGTVSVVYGRGRSLSVGLGPLLMAAVAAGLAMGIGATLWHDLRRFLRSLRASRRLRHAARLQELLVEASNARAAGRIDRARECYQRALKIDPENLTAVAALGTLMRHKGAVREAIPLHRLAARLAPERMAPRLAIIDDYVAMEAYESAAQQIEAGLKDDAKHQGLLTRLRDVRLAAGDWAGAAAAQERLMKSPMDGLDSRIEGARLTGFRYEAAMALLAEGHGDRAREALSALTRQATDFAPAYMALGALRMRQGNPREALKVYQSGYEHTRDESLLPPIENLLIVHLEDPRGAIEYFTRLLDRDPKSPRLHYWLGRVHYRLEMIDDALQVLSELEGEVERFPELTELMVRIHLRRQALPEALALLGEGSPAIPYACRACGSPAEGWAARCPACGNWGAVAPALSITPRPEPSGSAPTPLLPAPT